MNAVWPLLNELKQSLQSLYGPRLKGVILYGSYARGTATSASDVDILVILDDSDKPIRPGQEIERMLDIVFHLSLKYDTLISVLPVSWRAFRQAQTPLLMNVHKEGIPV